MNRNLSLLLISICAITLLFSSCIREALGLDPRRKYVGDWEFQVTRSRSAYGVISDTTYVEEDRVEKEDDYNGEGWGLRINGHLLGVKADGVLLSTFRSSRDPGGDQVGLISKNSLTCSFSTASSSNIYGPTYEITGNKL